MGGHGGLNILPQKSWNVYSAKNRARVAADEEQAAIDAANAQFEAVAEQAKQNLQSLRARAAANGEMPPPSTIAAEEGHVNFFAREERAAAAELGGKTAEEHAEDEAKDAREKRKLGFFAAPVALKAPEGPWYAGAPDPSAVDAGAEASGAPRLGDRKARDGTTRQDRDDARRRAADPMRGLVAIPRRGADAAAPPALPPPPAAPPSSDSDSSDDRRRRRRRKEKKEKKAKKRKRKDQDRDAFAELRRQRLEREATERRRAARVLALHDSGGDVF